MTRPQPLGLGLIGCGGFGLFCLDAFARLDGIQAVAAADPVKAAADRAAERHPHLAVHYNAAELIDRDDVHLVHVATPPATHHPLALRAARAGKHVLCEKPLAMNLTQADEILDAARRHHVIMPVNFVIRHNPVTDAVKAIIQSRLLGRPLRAAFENYASDENLPPEHWFWDKNQSGGIFVEHGVHFFDLYRHWLGPGRVVSAHAEIREATAQEDRVACTVRHDNGTLASHYHGFDQPGRMDRTDHRILFETGDIAVTGWIPTALTVHAILDDRAQAQLEEICASLNVHIECLETYRGDRRTYCSRGRKRLCNKHLQMTAAAAMTKQDLYASSVADLLQDQLRFIADPAHTRRVTEPCGRDALAMANDAARIAGDARHWNRPSA